MKNKLTKLERNVKLPGKCNFFLSMHGKEIVFLFFFLGGGGSEIFDIEIFIYLYDVRFFEFGFLTVAL